MSTKKALEEARKRFRTLTRLEEEAYRGHEVGDPHALSQERRHVSRRLVELERQLSKEDKSGWS